MDLNQLKTAKLRSAGPTRVTRLDGSVRLEFKDGKTTNLLEGGGAAFVEAASDPDLACILPGRLYLGSQDSMFNEGGMRDAGIELVIHLAYLERPESLPADIRYLRASVLDSELEELLPKLERHSIFDEIDGAERGVLVTCNAGVSRSTSAVLAYLMQRKGMSFEAAHDKIRSVRPQIRVNNFERELRKLELDQSEKRREAS